MAGSDVVTAQFVQIHRSVVVNLRSVRQASIDAMTLLSMPTDHPAAQLQSKRAKGGIARNARCHGETGHDRHAHPERRGRREAEAEEQHEPYADHQQAARARRQHGRGALDRDAATAWTPAVTRHGQVTVAVTDAGHTVSAEVLLDDEDAARRIGGGHARSDRRRRGGICRDPGFSRSHPRLLSAEERRFRHSRARC